ncbi:MAG: translational GTPase TypA [Deltaproteobacteria bacterium]|nr:MAG: translational GTPase TypA [Deltaproteobacteria bacterium]TNF28327.1 MAG: translational GTPase TypA [Deltaproteobacteria bacterium]
MTDASKLKNIAVVAHVDHGKTTLVDCLLHQSGTFDERAEIAERVMDSGDQERERGITITAKNCAIEWDGYKINLLDTPGHADFGGEVERGLMMVDGVLLLVDAAEGPLPQTRFVLTKAMERNLKIALIINKVDRPDARTDEVKHEVEDLLLDLATMIEPEDFDIDIPVIYASAKEGWANTEGLDQKSDMKDLLNFMVTDYFPSPKITQGNEFQLLVANLAYDNYLGSLLVGRIQRGTINKHQTVVCMGEDKDKNFKVTNLQVYSALGTEEVNSASAGEIVLIAGLDNPHIGDTICDTSKPEALPRLTVEPPTVGVNISVNTSPFSGKEGEYMTSRKLEELLEEASKINVALAYEGTDDPKVYKLLGRGELQLAVVFEEWRRRGFEFMISRPEVVLKEVDGSTHEPFEKVVLDIPSDCTGPVTEKLSIRKGTMESMMPLGDDRTRMEFVIPSRGLIGYRSTFLTDTRGEGLMSSEYLGYRPWVGQMLARQNGCMVADRAGKMTPYALFNLLSSGTQFVKPGEECYEGMVIGEGKKVNDINVNAVREKHLSSVRTAGKDENIALPPIRPRTLEWAMDWIDNDEWVEITPENIRIRKKILLSNMRSVVRKDKSEKNK